MNTDQDSTAPTVSESDFRTSILAANHSIGERMRARGLTPPNDDPQAPAGALFEKYGATALELAFAHDRPDQVCLRVQRAYQAYRADVETAGRERPCVMTRAQALAAGKAVMRRPGAGREIRRLAIVYGDAALEADLHPSPLAQRRERRLRRLLERWLNLSALDPLSPPTGNESTRKGTESGSVWRNLSIQSDKPCQVGRRS